MFPWTHVGVSVVEGAPTTGCALAAPDRDSPDDVRLSRGRVLGSYPTCQRRIYECYQRPDGRGSDRAVERPTVASDSVRRLSTETKAAFKTTEFMAYLAVLVGIFIAGAVTSAGVNKAGVHHADVFPAHQVRLYATVLTIGYVISRGLAKSGSKQHYDEA